MWQTNKYVLFTTEHLVEVHVPLYQHYHTWEKFKIQQYIYKLLNFVINLRKVFKIVLTCGLMVALISITILLTIKYTDEKTTTSIKYDQNKWIELPSITFCSQKNDFSKQPNMTFDEYMKQTHLMTDQILTANFTIFTPHRQ